MADYPATGSTLNSSISTGLSTQIVVKVGSDTVGALQTLTVNQVRNLYRVGEIGLDGTLEIVPNQKPEVTLNVTRIVFDRLRLPESFARGFVNIKAQRLPFDILVIDRTLGTDQLSTTHIYTNAWFQSYTTPYNQDNYIISETGVIWAEDVSSIFGASGNAAQGGARDMKPQIESVERAADRGERRGTMDAPGIISAAFE